MTDIAKAIAFATHCLKWPRVKCDEDGFGRPVYNSSKEFRLDCADELAAVLEEFLGKRYFIQINRGNGSLFHWRVIVGWQDRADKSMSTDNAVGVGEDLWDAIFDACIAAQALG